MSKDIIFVCHKVLKIMTILIITSQFGHLTPERNSQVLSPSGETGKQCPRRHIDFHDVI